MAKTQYYTATTLDGYIADENHSLDWLFEVDRETQGEHSFAAFFGEVGAMAMGATTYEWVLEHDNLLAEPDKWRGYYADTQCWVFTHRDLPPIPGAAIHFVQGDVGPVHAQMTEAAAGNNIWLVGGGDLVGQFADAGTARRDPRRRRTRHARSGRAAFAAAAHVQAARAGRRRPGQAVRTAPLPRTEVDSGRLTEPGRVGSLRMLMRTSEEVTRRGACMGTRAFERQAAATERDAPARPRTAGFSPAELVLELQRTAGNRALVSSLQPHAALQRKEDWNFTPADYAALVKQGKELRFAADSAWFPEPLQQNLLATLKFALTSKKPVRTAGVSVKDFYHGHFVVPKAKATADLRDKVSAFDTKTQAIQGKALGGEWFNHVTKENLAAYTKAMQETEQLATALLAEALKIDGAAVHYHTFENSGWKSNFGSATRNILTPIGGAPAGYDPSGTGKDANAFRDKYQEVLQFAFLVDETGVVHVTVGTVPNLSRVTGTPLDF